MRRFTVFLSIVAVLLTSVVALHMQPVVVAQEATPSSDMEPEGATFEPLGFAQGVTLANPADIIVARFGLDAGDSFPFEPNDPTNTMVVMETGTLTVRVEEVAWTITRGAALREMMAAPEEEADMSGVMEEVAMGAEATLAAGDVAYIPGSVNGEVRNDGQEPAAALLFVVGPPEALLSATPEP
jgi:quercetin dioxygenase-like cupin family protein